MPIIGRPTVVEAELGADQILNVSTGDGISEPALNFGMSWIGGTDAGTRTYGWNFDGAVAYRTYAASVIDAAFFYANGTPSHVNGTPSHVNGTPTYVDGTPNRIPNVP